MALYDVFVFWIFLFRVKFFSFYCYRYILLFLGEAAELQNWKSFHISGLHQKRVGVFVHLFLWSPYGIGQTIIFLPCDFYLSLWPPYVIGGHYIFALWLLSFFLSIFSSSPNLSGRTLDVYYTSTHGVAVLRIRMQVWNVPHATGRRCRTQKSR